MGEVVSELGFSPDPEKISAVHNMPTPSCKQDLQRLLGMINYLGKYIPNMSELTAPWDPYSRVMHPGLGFLSMTLHFPKSNQF